MLIQLPVCSAISSLSCSAQWDRWTKCNDCHLLADHTQHEHRPTGTHTLTHNDKSHYLCCPSFPSFFLSSFLCFLLTYSNTQTFIPLFFVSSFFSDVLWHSNPSLVFFFYFYKGAAPQTDFCWHPWQQPFQFNHPFTPHQGIPWTLADPLNPLATPNLLTSEPEWL